MLVTSFARCFESKRDELDEAVELMEDGLKVMREAESDAFKLKTAVTELQLTAEEKKEEFESLQDLFVEEEARVVAEEAKVKAFEDYASQILGDAQRQRELVISDLNEVPSALFFFERTARASALIPCSQADQVIYLIKV